MNIFVVVVSPHQQPSRKMFIVVYDFAPISLVYWSRTSLID